MSDVLKDLFAGSVAGALGCAVGHPLDTLKVRMQSDPGLYGTASRTLSLTLRREGIQGLFRGIAPPLVSIALYQAVCFASFNASLRLVSPGSVGGESMRPESAPASTLFAAGSLSGAATVLVTTPTDLLKIRLQTEARGTRPAGGGGGDLGRMLRVAGGVFRSGGLRGFYRGGVATGMRDTWSTGLYFVVYHAAKRFIRERGGEGGVGYGWRACEDDVTALAQGGAWALGTGHMAAMFGVLGLLDHL